MQIDGKLTVVGNVGVGTASPGYKLDVAGQINVQAANPYLRLTASGAAWDVQSSSNHFDIRNGTVLALNVDDTNGNVGIGTTAPTARLDVAGDLHAEGEVRVNGTVAIGTDAIARQSYYAP